MRGLKDRFIADLQTGKLAWFLEELKKDKNLFLSIEQNYVNIFYRGKNILEIKAGGGYSFIIDEKYFASPAMKEEYAIFNRDKKAAGVYQRKFPILIQAMDESYGTLCHPQDEAVQKVANANTCIIAMDYKIPASCGEGQIDMIGIHQGHLVAFQHNRGQNVATISAAYNSLVKIWNDPAEKEKLINSANDVGTNLMVLGLLEEAPHVTAGDLIFVPLLTDCDAGTDVSAQFQGTLPVKPLFLGANDFVLDMSKVV